MYEKKGQTFIHTLCPVLLPDHIIIIIIITVLIQHLTLTLSEVSKRSTIMQHNYPGFSSAAVTRAAFQGINSYQVPIYFTWVECGKCRSMSCQRTLVQRRDIAFDVRNLAKKVLESPTGTHQRFSNYPFSHKTGSFK